MALARGDGEARLKIYAKSLSVRPCSADAHILGSCEDEGMTSQIHPSVKGLRPRSSRCSAPNSKSDAEVMQVFCWAALAVAVLAGAENQPKSDSTKAVSMVRGQCVRLADAAAFLSSFDGFDDELNGLTEAKLQRTGRSCIIVDVRDDRTMTCEFRDQIRLDFPWESAESTVSCDFLSEQGQLIHAPLITGDAGRNSKEPSGATDISSLRRVATERLEAPVAEAPAGAGPTQRELLADFSASVQIQNVSWFVIWGTLLGGLRDADFIPWTEDVDVAIVDITKSIGPVIRYLEGTLGYTCYDKHRSNFKKGADCYHPHTKPGRFTRGWGAPITASPYLDIYAFVRTVEYPAEKVSLFTADKLSSEPTASRESSMRDAEAVQLGTH